MTMKGMANCGADLIDSPPRTPIRCGARSECNALADQLIFHSSRAQIQISALTRMPRKKRTYPDTISLAAMLLAGLCVAHPSPTPTNVVARRSLSSSAGQPGVSAFVGALTEGGSACLHSHHSFHSNKSLEQRPNRFHVGIQLSMMPTASAVIVHDGDKVCRVLI